MGINVPGVLFLALLMFAWGVICFLAYTAKAFIDDLREEATYEVFEMPLLAFHYEDLPADPPVDPLAWLDYLDEEPS